ncbi:MAG: hypothetical protein H7Y07_04545 [Pyrinomonadaceae bacterium]|nr:hypothetical protein [Sphingobacteriaceae bacterium]
MKRRNDFKLRIFTSILLGFSVLLFSQCKKESSEMTPQTELSQPGGIPAEFKPDALSATGIISTSYYLEKSLPAGYVKNGTKDYTSYLQAALNKYSNIVFPGFPILVNDGGINIGSNKTITFLPGSEIRLKATSHDSYTIMELSGVSNVTLYNPVIIGDRDNHIGTSGEHGIGLGIRGSTNVTVYSPKISNCWGDGIYISSSSGHPVSKNIIIKDAYLRKNRRDGISIISVDGLVLDNLYAGYTDGTTPMSGINFEPNDPSNEIRNVLINNPRTEYNGSNGIQIGNRNMLGRTNKQSEITIVNHVDIGSPRYAVKMMCNSLAGTTAKMSGFVKVINPTWRKTGTNRPLYLSSNQAGLKTTVSSAEVMTTSGTILSAAATNTLLMKEARSGVLSVANIVSSSDQPQSPTTGATVFAVNAGGASFSASNGITYNADKSFSGGTVYKPGIAISNTTDDALYQTERFGNFNYAIPLSNGTYEITFKMAEIFHQNSGRRQFDVLAESVAIISNLDLFKIVGYATAYDLVKTVSVTDGTLNLTFRSDINNAKIAAFHIIKK